MTPCKAILFDIDDTIVDFKKSEGLSLSKCYAKFFKGIVDFEGFCKDYSKINRSLWNLAEENKISPSIIGKERFKQLSEYYGQSSHLEIPEYYEQQLIQNSSWVPEAPELLQFLKEKNIKIGFVTNGFSFMQKSKFEKLNLAQYSDILVISEEVGFSKPHPQIFLHALDLIKAEPNHTLMVGDSLSSDGMGARNVGLPFCWYNPKQIPHNLDWQPHYIISNLISLVNDLKV